MNPMKNRSSNLLWVSAVAAALCGCVTPSKPDPSYVSEDFGRAEIRQLAVLPLLDARLDRSEKLNQRKMDRGIKKFTRSPLRKRGYEPSYFAELQLPAVPSGLLEHPDAELLKSLCPPGQRYCLLFVLEDLSQRRNFLSSETGTVLAMGIVDATQGTVLYHDMDVRRESSGGTLGLAMAGTTQYNSMIFSVEAMVKKLPSRTGN
jgi:hypothetical protein